MNKHVDLQSGVTDRRGCHRQFKFRCDPTAFYVFGWHAIQLISRIPGCGPISIRVQINIRATRISQPDIVVNIG